MLITPLLRSSWWVSGLDLKQTHKFKQYNIYSKDVKPEILPDSRVASDEKEVMESASDDQGLKLYKFCWNRQSSVHWLCSRLWQCIQWSLPLCWLVAPRLLSHSGRSWWLWSSLYHVSYKSVSWRYYYIWACSTIAIPWYTWSSGGWCGTVCRICVRRVSSHYYTGTPFQRWHYMHERSCIPVSTCSSLHCWDTPTEFLAWTWLIKTY